MQTHSTIVTGLFNQRLILFYMCMNQSKSEVHEQEESTMKRAKELTRKRPNRLHL